MKTNFNIEEIAENILIEAAKLISEMNSSENPRPYDEQIIQLTKIIIFEFENLKKDHNYQVTESFWRMIVDSYPWDNSVSKALKKYTDYLDYKYYEERRGKKLK
jgi:hypothetical protein